MCIECNVEAETVLLHPFQFEFLLFLFLLSFLWLGISKLFWIKKVRVSNQETEITNTSDYILMLPSSHYYSPGSLTLIPVVKPGTCLYRLGLPVFIKSKSYIMYSLIFRFFQLMLYLRDSSIWLHINYNPFILSAI